MANKCASCGKFHSATDGVVCGTCAGTFHRDCAGLLEEATVPADWSCLGCKRKQRQSNSDGTPVRAVASPYAVTSQASGSSSAAELITRVDLAQEIRSFREELASVKIHCSNEIRGACGELRELREEILCFKSAILACNKRLEELEKRMEAVEKIKGNSNASPHIANLEHAIENLKMDLQDRDQDMLANDIQVSNIPEARGENPAHIVSLIAVKLGITVDERDIVSAQRVGASREGAAEGTARPRPLVIRVARRYTRDELLRAARVRRGLTTAGMGFEGEPTRFYVNERLTRLNRQLFGKARDLCKQHSWRFVWTRDGRVYVRRAEGKPASRIRSINDLTNIFGVGSVSSVVQQ